MVGKLYDKKDLSWNTDYWNRIEAQVYASIANGSVSSRDVWQGRSELNMLHTFAGAESRVRWDSRAPRHVSVKDAFEHERKRERFKLLLTGRLLRDLDTWETLFKNCAHCYIEKGRTGKEWHRPCDKHKDGYLAAREAVYWAGKRNVEERAARGQVRSVEEELVATAEHLRVGDQYRETAGALNKWEAWYLRDRKEGIWPQDAKYYDEEPTYEGWLGMLLQEEEISTAEYQQEVERWRKEKKEAEENATPVAGKNSLKLTARQRDSRYNRLSA